MNGSATVNEITVNGIGAGNTTGYTFTWFQSNGTTVIPGSGSAATIAVPLAAGNYFVQATNTATNCKSANTPFTINDTHVNPVVAAATTINNTNCTGATPNGSITINIGGVAPVAGQFNVEWFEGNGTTTALGTTVGSVTGVSNITAQATFGWDIHGACYGPGNTEHRMFHYNDLYNYEYTCRCYYRQCGYCTWPSVKLQSGKWISNGE